MINTNWLLQESKKLPDFIIGGAMKSATTTLHAILHRHPDISIAHEEIGFFDIDNLLEHPDFAFFDAEKNSWHTQFINQSPAKAWEWYLSNFPGDDMLRGEDSTTYLASPIAAKRIGMQHKNIKMIFILRHPTQRTISNYYHLLKSGRAEYNLEKTLEFNPSSIIRRSLYKVQLESYYKYLSKNNIKIVLFEDFLKAKEKVIKDITEFLGVDYAKFKEEDLEVHSNKTVYFKYESILLLKNRLLRSYGRKRYSSKVPFPYSAHSNNEWMMKMINKIHRKINPKTYDKPTIHQSTIDYLDEFFKVEMQGIDELTGLEIYDKWFKG